MTTQQKKLAITVGDPCGIGPEVALKAALRAAAEGIALPVLVGPASVLAGLRAQAGEAAKALQFHEVAATGCATDHGRDARATGEVASAEEFEVGRDTAAGGSAAYAAIIEGIRLAREGVVQGVVTAPISKLALHLAGIHKPGHTEIFAEETGTTRYAMGMFSDILAVGLVTCHVALREAISTLTAERIVEVGELLAAQLAKLRGGAPRLAVLGLNPHAGEGGLMGREEIEIISPAIAELRRRGHDVEGPLPPDTAFTPAARRRYQGHLAMYHDQGLIPFKSLCMESGVNVTMGLPFVRTSPDHGTAFDIAGRGIADESSMFAAICMAARLA